MHDSGSGASGKLFQNATEDNLITGVTIGLFNFKDVKRKVARLHIQVGI